MKLNISNNDSILVITERNDITTSRSKEHISTLDVGTPREKQRKGCMIFFTNTNTLVYEHTQELLTQIVEVKTSKELKKLFLKQSNTNSNSLCWKTIQKDVDIPKCTKVSKCFSFALSFKCNEESIHLL